MVPSHFQNQYWFIICINCYQQTKFCEILIEIQIFSFKEINLKMSSTNWWPFCLMAYGISRPVCLIAIISLVNPVLQFTADWPVCDDKSMDKNDPVCGSQWYKFLWRLHSCDGQRMPCSLCPEECVTKERTTSSQWHYVTVGLVTSTSQLDCICVLKIRHPHLPENSKQWH